MQLRIAVALIPYLHFIPRQQDGTNSKTKNGRQNWAWCQDQTPKKMSKLCLPQADKMVLHIFQSSVRKKANWGRRECLSSHWSNHILSASSLRERERERDKTSFFWKKLLMHTYIKFLAWTINYTRQFYNGISFAHLISCTYSKGFFLK